MEKKRRKEQDREGRPNTDGNVKWRMKSHIEKEDTSVYICREKEHDRER